MKVVYGLILALGLNADRLATGTLLVADKKLDDPNFRSTVVLIADRSDGGTSAESAHRDAVVGGAGEMEGKSVPRLR